MSDGKSSSLWRTAVLQIASGGSAGFIEVCLMQPLDVVKTRLQLQSSSAPKYNGVIDVFAKTFREEGVFAFWKGILPPILVETPKRAVKFLVFEQSKPLYMFGSPTPTPLTFSLAGLTAGVCEAILCNPFEVVKVSLQANTARMREAPSTLTVTKRIVRTDGWGFSGLNKGLTATMCRNGTFNTIYFGFYHSVKDLLPQAESSTMEFFRKAGIGFVSGTLASMANIPFDVAKSRIQGPQPVPGERKYHGTLRTIQIVYAEEGVKALYKGLVPKVLRLGPGGAIMLVAYDYTYHYLQEKF